MNILRSEFSFKILCGEKIQLFKGTLSGLRQFLATATPLNLMQKTFLFNLRIPFHFQVSTFCFDAFLMQKSDLIRKIRLISKFMM